MMDVNAVSAIAGLFSFGKLAGGPGSGFWYPGLGFSASSSSLPDY
jgi:hypothetical protein